MNILIVNNGTRHITELKEACIQASHHPTIISWQEVSQVRIADYDKIILSGSSQFSVPHEKRYAPQEELIACASVPLLGICAGFQIICSVYGSSLVRSPYLISGCVAIRKTAEDHFLFGCPPSFHAYEHHRYYCPAVKAPLVPLAVSNMGVEMVRHSGKPIFGCQFHPEAQECTNESRFILERFLAVKC